MSIAYDANLVSTHAGHRSTSNPVSGLLNAFRALVSQYEEFKDRRNSFKTLLQLDENMLEDVGMTRGDIRWAARLPLSVNASLELRKIAERRRIRG